MTWLTPKALYNRLDAEFGFTFDPCPHPLPPHYNSLVEPWGKSNFVHPPYRRDDCVGARGPTAFARKALSEHHWHNRGSVLLLPVPSYVNLLCEAGGELRPLGRVAWIDALSGQPCSRPQHVAAFVLRSK